MIDTHTHLFFPQFDADRNDILLRARAAGITHFVVPGTDEKTSAEALALAEKEDDVFAAMGIHPQDTDGVTEEIVEKLTMLLSHAKVCAVGEVGFERSSRAPDIHHQETVLRWFVECAVRARKPLIYHVRDAHTEFRRFLQTLPEGSKGVVHCFSGTAADAEAYLQAGLFISVTGIVTFPNADPLRTALGNVPLERLLLETDSPFLAPQSVRGKRNEPAYVVDVAKTIATLKNVSLQEVEQTTDANAKMLFGLP